MSRSEKELSHLTQIKIELKELQERLKQIQLTMERSHSSVHSHWKYLFICGCPRSGTTVTTKLLNAHPLIAIGAERYKHYANQDLIHKLSPALFKASVFFDIREEQTNINPQHQAWEKHWKYFYDELKEKFKNNTTILGDKFPYYYKFYQEINELFASKGVKFVFLLRDIKDVALSYDARARNKNDIGWSRNQDYKSAVSDWNQSLLTTWNYLESNKQINLFVCEYERLFSGDDNYFNFLLNFLELEKDQNMYIYYKSITKEWERLKQRKNIIHKDKLAYLDQNSNFFLRDQILQKYTSFH